MKNNTRYKGNTNNTCVIIFLRNSQRCYFAWDNLQWDFCYVSCCSSFLCCVFILLLYLHLSMFFILLLFLLIAFRRHPSPFRGLSPGFLHPILYFQPGPSQTDSRHFHFLTIPSCRECYSLEWPFFTPQAFFTLRSFTDILTCVDQGFPESCQFFLEVCRASYWSSKHRPGPFVYLIHSNPQTSYSERFRFKLYHILAWIAYGESLIYLLLTHFELLSLVQTHM